jgi:serpin B
MKRIIKLTITASIACLLFACNGDDTPSPPIEKPEPAKPIELTFKQDEKVSADNCFALKMFREVSNLAETPNTFFSPLSLNLALGMLYNGASGDTRTEMAEVLGMADYSETEINEYYQKMSQALLDIDPLTELAIANSIWYRDGFPVKQPFIDINKKHFDAEVKALDFNNPDAAKIINQWCANKTKDRIKDIIQPPISPDVMMYLINALYFKSKWESQFDKSNTKKDDFTKANNSKIKVNMMEQRTPFPYYADEHLQCVELPYGNMAFSMVAILPAENSDIDRLIEYLDETQWNNISNYLHHREVILKLPRFKIECEMDLNDPVKNIGMQRIFYGGFEHISDFALNVSNIKQKTFVEVNEEGTEAAAVTVIAMELSAAGPSTPVQFFANRPFLYVIKEKSTGAILFIGRMDEPQE